MSDLVRFPPEPEEQHEALYLIGFRLDPNSPDAQIFTILALNGENDRPLSLNGRVLLFAQPELGGAALARSDNGLRQLGEAPREVAFVCDIAEALHVINSQDADEEGVVLEAISFLDDLIRATGINVPAQYMSVLSALSERLNETSDFGSWLAEQGVDRETVEDALMWCVGAVAVKSTVIDSE